MKNSITILLFVILAYSVMIASAQNTSSRYIVFQPDNRTTSLSQDDVNRIWKTQESLAGMAGQVMPRENFLSMAQKIKLMETGSNLQSDLSLRKQLAAEAGTANLIFTRIINWGSRYNVSMEMVSTPRFMRKRAVLPLEARIDTPEQIIEKIPELMKQLGITMSTPAVVFSELYMIPPKTPSRQLETFYTSMKNYLEENGVKMTDDSASKLKLSVVFDVFDSSSQTLYLPMQKRQIVKSNVNLEGRIIVNDNNEITTFPFRKTTERTSRPNAAQLDIDSFIESAAKDSAANVMGKLQSR
ncbi:MAG: hypothetical protein IKP58_05540 [Victivallales bacterium]|nr:hypothetical protein [Victivallales bacterium]